VTNCPYPASARSKSFHCKHDGDLQREYGPQLTCDVYWTQFWAQDGACAICRTPWPGVPGEPTGGIWRLSTDHHHATGQDGPFRGLLCGPCNRLLTWELEREIARRDSAAPFRWTDHDGKPTVITAELIAYVREPPAAGLRIWVTKKERPARSAGAAKPGPRKLEGPSIREKLRPHPDPCGPDCWRTQRRPPEPSPVVPVVVEEQTVASPRWAVIAAGGLLCAGGLAATVLAVIIIVKLLPGLLLLAATGLLALRR
jgi:hypothetical protein